jgi:hypothetical protein
LKQNAPWVNGGRGGAKTDRGMQSSGAIGEVLKTDENPQINTAVQRSWLYNEDPMFEARRTNMERLQKSSTQVTVGDGASAMTTPATPNVSSENSCSIKGLGDKDGRNYNPDGNFKRSSSITKYLDPKSQAMAGVYVFKDEAEAII